ncbi:PREDICTED: 5-hydroxytryptamine receptor 3A-like [Nanorana parkeri]|uniref:5-hydroxytryptamine receptor 3A-like n=1 Tax=Nanorana parkeri TaxID=125878 RepID=UPI0008546642|nr:PREDICTED: 5-hydroxytryptamine receptor 3A-like [Nanorana parkeri]
MQGKETFEEKTHVKNATVVKLVKYLMDGYNKGIRPVQNWRRVTTVNIDITLYAILGVDEKNQLLSTYIWYKQSWVDEFLTWDPMKFDNVLNITLPVHMVWVPDMTVTESVNAEKPPEISYVFLLNNGRVLNYKPMQITSTCTLDIFYFPFDYQNCTLTFVSWMHTTFEKREINETYYVHHINNYGEWELSRVIPKYEELTEDDMEYGEVSYIIIIKRKPLFYAINLIFPSMLLMIMDIVGFYLPPEGGERISFKVTLLLGYSVFLIIVSEQLPATGEPLIGVYFTLCMIMLVVSLMESIMIVRIVHKENLHPEVPKWLKKLVLEILAPMVCLSEWARFNTPKEQDAASTEETETSTEKLTCYNNKNALDDNRQLPVVQDSELLHNILKEVAAIREHVKKSDHKSINQEWLRVGYIIDKLLFRAYLTFFLIKKSTV